MGQLAWYCAAKVSHRFLSHGAVVLVLLAGALPAISQPERVRVVGYGATAEEARQDAIRAALDVVSPQSVFASRVIDKGDLLVDRLESAVEGYVHSFKELTLTTMDDRQIKMEAEVEVSRVPGRAPPTSCTRVGNQTVCVEFSTRYVVGEWCPVPSNEPVKEPRRIRYVAPSLPAEARAAGAFGTVRVEVTVGKDGTTRVGKARMLGAPSTPPGTEDHITELLKRAALDAVRQWMFDPSTCAAKPVNVLFVTAVEFPDERPAVVTMAQFERVQEGMSYDAVVRIIGAPGKEERRMNLGGTITVWYSWTNPNGSSLAAGFQNGRLFMKVKGDLP